MSEARGSVATWLAVGEDERPPETAAPPQQTKPKSNPIPGFYAGNSRGEPLPPRDRRKAVALAVAVVAAVAGVAFVARGGGDQTATPPAGQAGSDADIEGTSEIGSTDTTSPATRTAMPVSEAVEIVEEGWYVHDESVGSYGFVIENTTDEVLGSFIVRVKAFDSSGEVISGLQDWKHLIGTMQPGERIGVADQLHHSEQTDDGISRLEFTVIEMTDDPMEGVRPPESIPDGTVEVGGIERAPGLVRTTVAYSVESTYDIPLDANAYVVFRDAAGNIKGGGSSFIDLPAQGTAHGDFDLRSEVVPPDAATVEVYVVPRLPI